MKGVRLLVILSSSFLFAGLAYIAFEPLPEGMTQTYIIKTRLAVFNIARISCFVAEHFGFDGPQTYTAVASVLGKFIHRFQSPSPVYKVTHEDKKFDGVPVRIYTPKEKDEKNVKAKDGKRAIVYFHGGGWIFGSIALYNAMCSKLSEELNAVVISVEYRLAPKHPFPAAIDDCFNAAKYLFKRTQVYGVDKSRISIMGDSAGGNLAAAVTQRLKDEAIRPLPKMQILIHPTLQAIDFHTPSMKANVNGPLLTRSLLVWFYNYYIFGHQHYFDLMLKNNHTHPHVKQNMPLKYMKPDHLPADEMLKSYQLPKGPLYGDIDFWNTYKSTFLNAYLAPLMTRTADIAGLPHTFIVSCQHDILRDDAFHYAARLRKENVSVEHVNLRICYHGWVSEYETRVVDVSRKQFKEIMEYIDSYL